jgi:hypothetical protein
VKSIIRSFSVPTEFCLVIFIGFGITIVGTLAWMINHLGATAPTPAAMRLNNDSIIEGVVFRGVTLSLVLWMGHIRGWSLATFGLRPSWKWTGVGVLLFLANGLLGRVLRLAMTEVFSHDRRFPSRE